MSYFKKLQKVLRSEEDLYYAWQANIAMAFCDEYFNYKKRNSKNSLNKEDIHKIANNAAKYFLDLLIEK